MDFVLDVLKLEDFLDKVVDYQIVKIIFEDEDKCIYIGLKKDFKELSSLKGFYVQHLSISEDNVLNIYIESSVHSSIDYNFDLISVISVLYSEDELCVTDFVTSEEYFLDKTENLFEITPTELDFRDFPIARIYVRGDTFFVDVLSNVVM